MKWYLEKKDANVYKVIYAFNKESPGGINMMRELLKRFAKEPMIRGEEQNWGKEVLFKLIQKYQKTPKLDLEKTLNNYVDRATACTNIRDFFRSYQPSTLYVISSTSKKVKLLEAEK